MTNRSLSPSLEDYLETIFLVVSERKIARVKDICAARDVKSGSVTTAMKRLEELGLVVYGRREFIELTPKGHEVARRVYARHKVLTSFFKNILGMDDKAADEEACAIEHHLTDTGMNRMVRFLEFLDACPGVREDFLTRFNTCEKLTEDGGLGSCLSCAYSGMSNTNETSLLSLSPGEKATVSRVTTGGDVRQRMLDMGILPGVPIRLERVAPTGDPIWVKVDSYQLSLRKSEAAGVLVSK